MKRFASLALFLLIPCIVLAQEPGEPVKVGGIIVMPLKSKEKGTQFDTGLRETIKSDTDRLKLDEISNWQTSGTGLLLPGEYAYKWHWRPRVIVKRPGFQAGLTLVEVLTSCVILTIAVLGTAAFRYNAALAARHADLQIAAARVALLLSEGWRAASDANAFDPVTLTDSPDLLITASIQGPGTPSGFVRLATCQVVAEGISYYATLSWRCALPGSSLKALNVVVAYKHPRSGPTGFGSTDKTFRLTTYTEN